MSDQDKPHWTEQDERIRKRVIATIDKPQEWTEDKVFAYFESEDFAGLAQAINAAIAAEREKYHLELAGMVKANFEATKQLDAERESKMESGDSPEGEK